MGTVFVFAIAADGKLCLVAEGCEQVEYARSFRPLQLGSIFAFEGSPPGTGYGLQSRGDQSHAGREIREPKVVIIALGKLDLRSTARRAAHGSNPQPFAGFPGEPRRTMEIGIQT